MVHYCHVYEYIQMNESVHDYPIVQHLHRIYLLTYMVASLYDKIEKVNHVPEIYLYIIAITDSNYIKKQKKKSYIDELSIYIAYLFKNKITINMHGKRTKI